jgi:hypothetical protein
MKKWHFIVAMLSAHAAFAYGPFVGHHTYTPRTTCWNHPCWDDSMSSCTDDMATAHPHSYYFQHYGTPPQRWTHKCFTRLTQSCHRNGTDVLKCNAGVGPGDSAGGAFPSTTSTTTTTLPPQYSFVGQYQFVGQVTYNDCYDEPQFPVGSYLPMPFGVTYDDGYGDLAGTIGKEFWNAQGQVGGSQWSFAGQQCDSYCCYTLEVDSDLYDSNAQFTFTDQCSYCTVTAGGRTYYQEGN